MKQKLSQNKSILFVLITSMIVWISSNRYDLFENISFFVIQYDKWEMDEIITVLLYLVVIFALLAYKKTKHLQREIQQRISLENDLEQSLLIAEAANRTKSDFLSTMSHELRLHLIQ